MGNKPILIVQNVSRHFGGVHAVENVSFELSEGEILGLVGDNGAGKSTLIKMISGVLAPNKGAIYWQSRALEESSPKAVRDLGIETVYQDLALADNLAIPANLFLGKEITKKLAGLIEVLDKKAMETAALEILRRLNIDIKSVRVPVRELSGGQRQAVAIGRALFWSARLFILDEPTAALGVKERRNILNLVKQLKREKVSIILISHNLSDISAVTDRILVMRRGNKVRELITAETNEAEIFRLMIGTDEG